MLVAPGAGKIGSAPIVVQKYGGSSVATPERMKNVASRVVAKKREGNAVVVVVSAMGKTTDELVRLSRDITLRPRRREMDMLLTAGERIEEIARMLGGVDVTDKAREHAAEMLRAPTPARVKAAAKKKAARRG